MESGQITCPFCWQTIDIDVPYYDLEPVILVTDCEVCCRPIEVTFTWMDPDGEPFVEVEAES